MTFFSHSTSKYFSTYLTHSFSSRYRHPALSHQPVFSRPRAIVWLEDRSSMTDRALTEKQYLAISALSAGYTIDKAAEFAGIQPTEIELWLRNFPAFRTALRQTHYSQALQVREKALALADRAFQTLSDILDDPEAFPSVRLKAATFIGKTAIAPPPYKREKPLGVFDLPWNVVPGKNGILAQQKRETEGMENEEEEENSQSAAEKHENPHKNAQKQEPYRRPGPKIVRIH
jgi:hypothetical protein